MAITKSAQKAIRQNKRRRVRNLVYINNLKDLIKNIRSLALQKKIKEAEALLPMVYQILDKSAKVGVIKKNNASRRKSRLAKMVATLTK